MRRVLQHPPLLGVVEADQLQVLLVPRVGVGPVLLRQPGRVARHVRQRLVADRLAGLPQQPPALLDRCRIHVVDAHELRVLDVVLRERRLHRGEDRVVVPGLARRPRLRVLRQPQLEPLVPRVGVQQPVQGGGAGARQADHEDRSLDRYVAVLGVLGEARLGEQPPDQRALHLAPVEAVAERGQPGLGRGEVVDQQAQPLLVRGAAEVVEARSSALLRRRCRRTSRSRLSGASCQLSWNSPQSTLSTIPVTALARSEPGTARPGPPRRAWPAA